MERFLSNIEHRMHEEDGFSTVGVALALLITLALIFSAAQVYEISSVSADVQDVADAASLAAENTVGEYCIVASICDAVVLSLSLSSLCCLGIGVACACTPPTAPASKVLFKAADKLRETRDKFSEKATEALEDFKHVLPVIAAAKASCVISANSGMRGGATYAGLAVLVPWNTDELEEKAHDKSDEAFDKAEEKKDALEALGKDAEEAAQRANAIKHEAWRHDCGSESAYCMYERAKNLAYLSASQNPYYSSPDTWDFDVALRRAQVYYAKRAAIEAPQGSSVEEEARSALRKRYYDYAVSEMAHGYVHRSANGFDAYFPLLPKNTTEMRATALYTESRYPISATAEGKQVLHAYGGCPQLAEQGQIGTGSLARMEGDPTFEICARCSFAPSSMGSVAAASSSIDNGFEYHYRKVAELARSYQEEQNRFCDASGTLKDEAKGLFDSIAQGLKEATDVRIKIDPPGKFGAIAFVITTNPGTARFTSRFVSSSGNLNTRAAISGATLVPESTEQGKTVINSLLDGIADSPGSAAVGAAQVVLDLWSGILKAYGDGQDAFCATLENALNALPFASESGLGQWAAAEFKTSVETLGLQPADLSPQKAVLVNTAHITKADSSSFSARLLSVKSHALAAESSDDLFGSAIVLAEGAVTDAVAKVKPTIQIASIQIIDGGAEIPITITLPQGITDAATDAIHGAFDSLKQRVATITGARRWE